MQRGNWIPINKLLVSSLPPPGSREYSEVEAAYCVTIDLDNGKLVSINGYAALWGWSRGRVRRFAEKMGWSVAVEVPRGLNRLEINRGKDGCVIHDPSWTKRTTDGTTGGQPADNRRTTGGQPEDNDNNNLTRTADNRRTTDGTTGGQPADNRRYTTIYPDPDPDPKDNIITAAAKKGIAAVKAMRPDWWTPEEWDELIEHRRAVKATQSVRAYKSLLKEFELARNAGDTPQNILDDITQGKGWAGYKWEWVCNRRGIICQTGSGEVRQPPPRTIRSE